MPNIYETLKSDHDEHRRLLAVIDDSQADADERRSAWKRFFHDVKAHAAAEEETFYSKLMSKTWGQDHARHSVQEHAELDELLDKVNEAELDSSEWRENFDKLRHDYEHHIDEEEDEIFARAREVIDPSEIDAYGERFLKRKSQESELIVAKAEDKLED